MTKAEAEQRIQEIRKEIANLRKEEMKLKRLVAEIAKSQKTNLVLNDFAHLTEESEMRVRLHSDTRTTPIMDDFYFSKKDFLIFERIFQVNTGTRMGWLDVSLIVRRGTPEVSVIDDGLTMTDLKKISGAVLSRNYFPKQSRQYSLIEEMLNAANKISDMQRIVPFEHAVRLGGQTYKNQTGYGSEYRGETLVVQGTLYGETTGFYVIGIEAGKKA